MFVGIILPIVLLQALQVCQMTSALANGGVTIGFSSFKNAGNHRSQGAGIHEKVNEARTSNFNFIDIKILPVQFGDLDIGIDIDIEDMHFEQLVTRIAETFASAPVDVDDPSIHIVQKHGIRHLVGHPAVAMAALAALLEDSGIFPAGALAAAIESSQAPKLA